MELKDAIAKRYSVRSYLDKKVDKELVKEILEVSKRAPSGVNSQPWKVYVVMGNTCLLYTSPSPRDLSTSRMPSSA